MPGLVSAAQTLGLEVLSVDIHSADELAAAIDTAARSGADGLICVPNPLLVVHQERVADLARSHRLPSVSAFREFAAAGGLMAYGPNLPALLRRAAYYVDRILKGAKPADLPVEQPMTFEFVVNMKTARELGITFPQEILLQVTEVID